MDLTDKNVFSAISEIACCETEKDVFDISKFVVGEAGGESFVYSTLRQDDRSAERDTYRYFIGCQPEWCKIYNDRKWFMNDPFVEYARSNTAPVVGSEIHAVTAGQIDMLEVAASYGFRSGMVIPTHSSANVSERMGMLYVGLDADQQTGEKILLRSRITFRALGMELLDWWMRHLYQESARKFKLSEAEIYLLQLSKNGLITAEIAAKLNLKSSAIYSQFGLIKEKFNVDKITDAVHEANLNGLLG
ncbi:autoinducer binding domain-containing protein [Glaciimonas sp. CA11.2]|uniref:autoinducer binding domain-containing protein n=1 Tax=Glaciimonas sp. CA11.2 TaxID=3048601 RepID=UPI002AB3B4BE|nr:autoinducer binding domain-containing protein [Glaciimonas sp. CA11.2]MDY7549210.1 autoinducer binding domain-containing protein [Glaciimonas sp. CA11.2]MEB0161532.1 autoinducer binding domain-containing protein [Glaciimonas sp. CA11.2]